MFRRSFGDDETTMFTFALMLVMIVMVRGAIIDENHPSSRHRITGTMVAASTRLDTRGRLRTAITFTCVRMVKAAAQHHVDEQQVGSQM